MALLNTGSLTDKTFTLNDFFTTRDLDFLLTETWLKPGKISAFSELLPPSCSFFSTPRAASHGGCLAAIFKESFRYKTITANNYSSFELQLFVIDCSCPVLLSTIYCPPNFNKNFLQEFSEFLSDFIPKFDKLLICGDFDIHVCYAANHLANEFKGLLDLFGLTQSVNAPTHEHGHTLDLVISHGLSVSFREIVGTAISDHLPIVFYFAAPPPANRPVSQLHADSGLLPFVQTTYSPLSTLHALQFWILLPLFTKKSTKTKANPRLNNHTHLLRQQCSVINPCSTVLSDASTTTCEESVSFFIDKVASVRQNINNMFMSPDDVCAPSAESAIFKQFEIISLSSLTKVVSGLKPTCPLDIIPAKFLREVF